jgi:hypothetical protein
MKETTAAITLVNHLPDAKSACGDIQCSASIHLARTAIGANSNRRLR